MRSSAPARLLRHVTTKGSITATYVERTLDTSRRK
jgi:hypothetical protein